MSKTGIGIAVVVLATLLSSAAEARRIGIGPVGIARFAVTRVLSLGGLHRARAYARHGYVRTAALRPQDVRNAVDYGPGNPAVRRQVVAAAALAGWQGGRSANGWWRHDGGGYGWVGPLFWPFAIYDIHDYATWGDGIGFWDYGYSDIHAAIFSPYGHDELAAYAGPGPHGRRHRRVASPQQLCGDSSLAGLPIDQIQQAIQLNEAQRAALEDLANALNSAAQIIEASCPAQPALSAPRRLAVMQQRVGAMLKAVSVVQQPLGKFYDLLDDEQEARLNATAEDRRKSSGGGESREVPARNCGAPQPAALQLQWPADEIEARVRPTEVQRAALGVLQQANARALDILNNACPPEGANTLPTRLDAVDGRLEAMQQAVALVSAALEDFYAMLSDEQKAQFEAIGKKRTA